MTSIEKTSIPAAEALIDDAPIASSTERKAPSSGRLVRLFRYSATSVLAFCVSEAVLLILYGTKLVDATAAALIANISATVPSYLMSRYWIWADAPRTRVGRQVVLYWATSIATIILSSMATGAIAALIPANHPFHLVLVGLGFLAVNVAFWLGKFAIYHWVIFPADRSNPTAQR